ncbi:hypothetical protein OG920_00900 [Streptomyces europaeiscabiei]|uniref:hypothetical protein n=1 Tax=Streptomyces TaxID=1883 RepID=UPI0015C50455|nr:MULTISPECIES: hypothetical protein [Streptomyces]MDX3586170.1 hypothetical protein [Streptomyces europaeiscabiei]MDX3617329.1 hypothetical protein [Streptomyces europaeiscabiei]MDX3636163.1 hypothetical protein [Streptomyces europaeiscabiei]MDX3654259.1 hypothetical protein [Streptomyces europaeiscabiei]WUD30126.1 hypothetical protein OG858_00965 [Streptomyces europaeiscabiei]
MANGVIGCDHAQGIRTVPVPDVTVRIADRTVADAYFAVSEKGEALYDAPRRLPADAEGTEKAKLRRELHRRMLGNGYCARPVEMDCHFESNCESCTFFVTTIEFPPTLERQRDDAAAKGAGAPHRLPGSAPSARTSPARRPTCCRCRRNRSRRP